MPYLQRIKEKEIELRGVQDIVVAGDIGCTGFSEDAQKIFARILRLKTGLFFLVGDLVFLGKKEEFEELGSFCDQNSTAPIYALCGNHDLAHYAKSLGLSTYSLILGRSVCVFLDNSTLCFKEEGLDFLRNELEKHRDKGFVILFHIPPPLEFSKNCMPPAEWLKLRAVTDAHKDRISCLISGHIHGFYEYRLDGYRIMITAGGGSAFMHYLPDEKFKAHNFLRLTLHQDGSVGIKLNIIQMDIDQEEGDIFLRRIPSELTRISKFAQGITEKIKEYPFSDIQLYDIRLSLEEALVNAAKHGNKLNPALYVEVSVQAGVHSLNITVADQGDGFDAAALDDPTQPNNLTKPCGRGLLLIREHMDRVEFLNSGRKIKMTKFFPESRPK